MISFRNMFRPLRGLCPRAPAGWGCAPKNAARSVWAAGRLAAPVLTEVGKQLDWIEGLQEHRGVKVLPLGGEQISVARDDHNRQIRCVLVRISDELPAVGPADGNVRDQDPRGRRPEGLHRSIDRELEVAKFVVCHEETVRRAYLRGLLISQRFGVRGRRFHPADVLDWITRGAPTRVSQMSLAKRKEE